MPAKLSARMRVYATGQGRKTDDTDAHSIALAGAGMTGLRHVDGDESLEVLRVSPDSHVIPGTTSWPVTAARKS